MKYKVGDKVRIKPLEVLIDNPQLNEKGLMNKYCGQIAKIIEIIEGGVYKLDIDKECRHGLGWFWYEDMLEDVDCENTASRSIIDSYTFPTFLESNKKEEHPISLIGKHKFLTLKVKS